MWLCATSAKQITKYEMPKTTCLTEYSVHTNELSQPNDWPLHVKQYGNFQLFQVPLQIEFLTYPEDCHVIYINICFA